MQVTVLLHMMRYFTENIVNLKKKLVRKYIVGCIITFFIYFSFFVVGLYIKVLIFSPFHIDEYRHVYHFRNDLCINEHVGIASLYFKL